MNVACEQLKKKHKKKILFSLISGIFCSGGVLAQGLPPITLNGESLTLTTSGTYKTPGPYFNAAWYLRNNSSLTANAPGMLTTIDFSAVPLATGIYVVNSRLDVKNMDLTMRGVEAIAVNVSELSQVSLTDVNISVVDPRTMTIYFMADATDSSLDVKRNRVVGDSFTGLHIAGSASTFTADGLSFDYTGPNSSTVFKLYAGDSAVTLNNTSSNNAGGTVFDVWANDVDVSVNQSTFTSNGSESVGILVNNRALFAPTFTNSVLQANKAVWQASDGSTLILSADRSSFTGISVLDSPTSRINASLNNGSSWTMTGSSHISNLNNNNSLVQFAAPHGDATLAASYKTLTIKEGYTSNGGVIALNTRLGGDDSPTDVLVLDGATVTGQTGLRVTNRGGTGDSTGVGIRVVQTLNGATTAEDSFYLDRSSRNYRPSTETLSVYGHEYSLVRGGDGGVADDWYLDSFADNSTPGPGPTPVPRPTPGSAINLSPELGAYVGNQVAAVKMFALSRDDRDLSRVPLTGDHSRGFWMRVQGGRDQNMKMETGRVTMSTNTYVVQLGGDVWSRQSGEQGRLVAGLMAGYGEARTNSQSQVFVRGANRTLRVVDLNADGTSKGYSVGGYFTWLSNEVTRLGTYVDSWVQYGHYDNSLSGEIGSSSYNSQLWSASVESGYAFKPFANARLVVEPQAQLIYSHYSADSMNLTNVPVKSMDYNEVDTRVGVRVYPLGKTMESSSIRPFAEVNWLYRSGTPKAEVGPYSFSIVPLRNAAQLKLGVEGKIGKSLYLTGQIMGYTGSDSLRGYGGMVNASYRW